MYEKNESLKTWPSIAKRLTNEKTIEKLKSVEGSMMMNKSNVQKQVGESKYDTRRKMRMIVLIGMGRKRKLTENK